MFFSFDSKQKHPKCPNFRSHPEGMGEFARDSAPDETLVSLQDAACCCRLTRRFTPGYLLSPLQGERPQPLI